MRLDITTNDPSLRGDLDGTEPVGGVSLTFKSATRGGSSEPDSLTFALEPDVELHKESNRDAIAAWLATTLGDRATALRMDGSSVEITAAAIQRVLKPRNLILCSDGTGNAGGKTRGTNVWRLFNHVDWHHPDVDQRAFYNDGVGTDAWRPLKILGGAFGWGLSANIRELYSFAALNYRPEDRLYFFGFSRGGFTVRSAVGLITRCGLLTRQRYLQNPELVKELLRIYRLPDGKRATELGKFATDNPSATRPVPIACIGVWDTVDAVGMPIDDLRGPLNLVWQLVFRRRLYGFEDQILNRAVKYGYQALSIDDERKTFHPNVWKKRNDGSIEQVWFAGAHSNVGGGNPKDGMAYVSLDWMMGKADGCGLQFEPGARDEVRQNADAQGKHYDSRTGLGVFYRYEPRDLESKPKPAPDGPTERRLDYTKDDGSGQLIEDSCVHVSVYERVLRSTAGYAPLFIPDKATVAFTDDPSEPQAGRRPGPWSGGSGPVARGLPRSSRDLIRKRVRARARLYWLFVAYALTLAFIAGLAVAFPDAAARQSEWPGRASGLLKSLLPSFLDSAVDRAGAFLLWALGVLLPAFLEPVVALGVRYLPWALGALFLLVLFRLASTAMKRDIADRALAAWASALMTPDTRDHGSRSAGIHSWLGVVRRSLSVMQGLLVGVVTPLAGNIPARATRAVTALAVLVILFDLPACLNETRRDIGPRPQTLVAVQTGCSGACLEGALAVGDVILVSLRAERPVNHTGIELNAGERYGVEFVAQTATWKDENFAPPPGGFDFGRNLFGYGLPRFWWIQWLRPYPAGHWFEVLGQVAGAPQIVRLLDASDPGQLREFVAERSGELLLFVNDVPYANNSGVLTLQITRRE